MSVNRCVYAFFGFSFAGHAGPARSTGGGKSAWGLNRRHLAPIMLAALAMLGWIAAAAMAGRALHGMDPVLLLVVQLGVSAGLARIQQPFATAVPVAPGGLGEAGFVFLLTVTGLVELATGATARVAIPELLVLGGLAALVLRWPVSGGALLRAAAVLGGIMLAVGFGGAATGERLAAAGMLASAAVPALAVGRGTPPAMSAERLLLFALLLLLVPLAAFRTGDTDPVSVPVSAWIFAVGSGLMLYATSFAAGFSTRSARAFARLAPIVGLVLILPAWGGLSPAALAGVGIAVTALLLLGGPAETARAG